jgi:hypothetical protein
MSMMRAYTREFRESAVGLVLSEGLSIRRAADDVGMPYQMPSPPPPRQHPPQIRPIHHPVPNQIRRSALRAPLR